MHAVADDLRSLTAVTVWPDHSKVDQRLRHISDLLLQTVRVARDTPPEAPSGAGRTDLARIVQIVAHTSRVILAARAATAANRVQRERLRHLPYANRSGPREPGLVRLVADRLDIEQIAGHYLLSHAQPQPPETVTGRLATALAAWDIQVHRSLATDPTSATIAKACKMQAFVMTAAVALTEAAAHTGLVDQDGFDRFEHQADTAQQAWTRAAARWAELVGVGSLAQPDRALLVVAAELRMAVVAACGDHGRLAPAAMITVRTDLPRLLHDVGIAVAASVDTAHVIGGLHIAGNLVISRHRPASIRHDSAGARSLPMSVTTYRKLIRLSGGTSANSRATAASLELLLPRPLRGPASVMSPPSRALLAPTPTLGPNPAPRCDQQPSTGRKLSASPRSAAPAS